MPSVRYDRMVERRDTLRRLLVPSRSSPSGNYKRVTKEKSFAYSLLMHAEVESYIEDMISDIAESAFQRWKATGVPTSPLISLAVYKEGNEIGFSEDVFNISAERKVETVISRCKMQFDARIRNNHGVRRKNISKLMISIGFIPDPSQEAVLSSLDGFGAKRGEYAHTSPNEKLLKQTDPITEANDIKGLIDNLSTLDQALVQYKANCGL